MADPAPKEIWKNVSPGLRHYIALNAIGEQTSKNVGAGRTFTITAMERRLNQEAVYDPSVDPFRDGTFLNVKATDDTVEDEIESPDSVTDAEIQLVLQEAIGGDAVPYEAMLARIGGINTATRIFEEAVAMDVPQSLVDLAREKMESLEELPIGTDGEPVPTATREVVGAVEGGKPVKQWTTRIE